MRYIGLLFISLFLFPPQILLAKNQQSPAISKEEKLTNYLNLAVAFKEAGDYEKAKEVIEKLNSLDKQEEALRYLGRLYFLQGDNEKALSVFRRLKEDWITFVYTGLALESQGKDSLAAKKYLASLDLKPNSVALMRLGKIYRRRGNYPKAISYFLELIQIDPSIRLAYYYLGDCFYEEDNYKKAYEFLSKAANFYPDYSRLKTELTAVKDKLGEKFFAAALAEKERKRKAIKLKLYKPQTGIPLVRVGLAVGIGQFSFSCGGDFEIEDNKGSFFRGKAKEFYSLVLKAGQIILTSYEGKTTYKVFTDTLKINSLNFKGQNYPFYVLDITYGENNFWHKKIDRVYRGSLEVITRNNKLTLINRLSVEEYVCGVLSAEIPAYSPSEALKAQAVAARTLAFRNIGRHGKEGFDFCADVHCQVYHGLSAETPETNQAVKATYGQIIDYNGKPIEAFYHANSGGCLCSDTFGELGYLVEKADAKEAALPESAYAEELWFLTTPETYSSDNRKDKFRWQRVYDSEDAKIALGFELAELEAIIPRDKGDCFHYNQMDIITTSGKRTLNSGLGIRRYFDQLKSSAFKLEVKYSKNKRPELILFWGGGFGHAAGMSQEGAMSMAEDNYNYSQILSHYYPNTKIKKEY